MSDCFSNRMVSVMNNKLHIILVLISLVLSGCNSGGDFLIIGDIIGDDFIHMNQINFASRMLERVNSLIIAIRSRGSDYQGSYLFHSFYPLSIYQRNGFCQDSFNSEISISIIVRLSNPITSNVFSLLTLPITA